MLIAREGIRNWDLGIRLVFVDGCPNSQFPVPPQLVAYPKSHIVWRMVEGIFIHALCCIRTIQFDWTKTQFCDI